MARVISLQLHGAHGERLQATDQVRGRVGGGLEGDSHVDREKRGVVVLDRSTNDALGLKPGDLREQITIEGCPISIRWPSGRDYGSAGSPFE